MIRSLFLWGALAFCQMVSAKDIAINAEHIPNTAQEILKSHFNESPIRLASFDTEEKTYSILLDKGQVLKFNDDGQWTMIDCKKEYIPFLLVPKNIRQRISQRFGPYIHATEMVKTRKNTFVKLDNGVEMVFKK